VVFCRSLKLTTLASRPDSKDTHSVSITVAGPEQRGLTGHGILRFHQIYQAALGLS
jgi:hypothetical protein